MRGRLCTVWHPDSPGSRVTVWRPWYRFKWSPFATLGEVTRSRRQTLDVTDKGARLRHIFES